MMQPIPQDVSDEPRSSRGPSSRPAQKPLRGGCWAHACRDDQVICGRVEIIVTADTRLGLAPRERRRIAMRFTEHVHPALRRELAELVHRRGSAARRAAERIKPVEVVFEDPGGRLQRITGWIEPPQVHHGQLREIEFGLREPTP